MKTGCSDDTVRGASALALAGVVVAAQGGRCRSLRLQREPSWTSKCRRCLVRGVFRRAASGESLLLYGAYTGSIPLTMHPLHTHTHDDGRHHRRERRRRRPREKQTRRAQRRDTRATPHTEAPYGTNINR